MLERILDLMEEKGVNAKTLTSAIGMGHSTVTNWKAGQAKPSYGALVKIANYFGVSVEYLQGKTDERNPITDENKKSASEKLGDAIKQLFIESGRIAQGDELTDEHYEYATSLIRAAVAFEKRSNGK